MTIIQRNSTWIIALKISNLTEQSNNYLVHIFLYNSILHDNVLKISLFILTVSVLCIGCNLFISNVSLLVYWLGYNFVDQWILIIMTLYCMLSHLFPNLKKKKFIFVFVTLVCVYMMSVRSFQPKQSQFYSILKTVYLDN